ncbi:MAG: hypothetical protein ACK4WD_09805 [Flavobacteriales bacterium]|jgi:hypothetical protein
MDLFLSVLAKISAYSPFLAALIANKARRNILWFYLIFGGLAELLGGLLKHRLEWHYEFLANTYISGEIVFYMTFFYQNLFRKKFKSYLIAVVLIWQGLFWIDTFNESKLVMNTSALGLNCLIYTLLSMLTYRMILIRQEDEKLSQNPVFWINTGIFLCSAGGCLFFILLDRVEKENIQFLIMLWMSFYCIINMIRYLFIGIGLNRLARHERF